MPVAAVEFLVAAAVLSAGSLQKHPGLGVVAASVVSPARAASPRTWSTGCACYRPPVAIAVGGDESATPVTLQDSLGSFFHPAPNSCRVLSNICANHWTSESKSVTPRQLDSEQQVALPPPFVASRLTALQVLERIELLQDIPKTYQLGRRFVPVMFVGSASATDVFYGRKFVDGSGWERVPEPPYHSGTGWTVVDIISASPKGEVSSGLSAGFDAMVFQADKPGKKSSFDAPTEYVVGLSPLNARHTEPTCKSDDTVCVSQVAFAVLESIRRLNSLDTIASKSDVKDEETSGPGLARVLIVAGSVYVDDPLATTAQSRLAEAIRNVLGQEFDVENVAVETSDIQHLEIERGASLACMKWCEYRALWAADGIPRPAGIEYLWKEVPNTHTRVVWLTALAVLVVLASWHGSLHQHHKLSTPMARRLAPQSPLVGRSPTTVSTAVPSQEAGDSCGREEVCAMTADGPPATCDATPETKALKRRGGGVVSSSNPL